MNVSFTYTPPKFINSAQEKEPIIFDQELYPESSNKIISHKEVLAFFSKKRGTIISWRKTRGFPEPISKSPMRWIRAAVMEWVEYQGGFKRNN